MNIGDYVRTKDGIIAKCIREECNKYVFDKIIVEDGYYLDCEYKDITPKSSNIKISSPNIIDLIEVGDYVNGKRVKFVYSPDGKQVFRIELDIDGLKGHMICENADIKSIVTKEQFESMKYKVKE